MSTGGPSDRAARLESLLVEHSYPERRSEELLDEIWRLLDDALRRDELALGSSPADVRRAIGPPFLRLGDEGEARFDWYYPRTPPAGETAGENWVLALVFRDGALDSISTRIWREGR